MELRAALAAQRLRELRAMPHGAGSGFRDQQFRPAPAACSSACGCCSETASTRPLKTNARGATSTSRRPDSRLPTSSRSSRASAATKVPPASCPTESSRRSTSSGQTVQHDLLAEYARRMDPAMAASRIPASQTWAIELLAGEAARRHCRGYAGQQRARRRRRPLGAARPDRPTTPLDPQTRMRAMVVFSPHPMTRIPHPGSA